MCLYVRALRQTRALLSYVMHVSPVIDRTINDHGVIDVLSLFCCSWAGLQPRTACVRMYTCVFV